MGWWSLLAGAVAFAVICVLYLYVQDREREQEDGEVDAHKVWPDDD